MERRARRVAHSSHRVWSATQSQPEQAEPARISLREHGHLKRQYRACWSCNSWHTMGDISSLETPLSLPQLPEAKVHCTPVISTPWPSERGDIQPISLRGADGGIPIELQLFQARNFSGGSRARCAKRRAKRFACCSAHCQPGWSNIGISAQYSARFNKRALIRRNLSSQWVFFSTSSILAPLDTG